MKFIMRLFDTDGKKVLHEEEISLDSLIVVANPKDIGVLEVGKKFNHYDDENRLRARIEVVESNKWKKH